MALSKEILNLQKTFSAGEVIFSEDDLSRDLYVLLRGKVEVLQKGVRLAELDKAGTFFGEMALLSGQPRSATLRAVENSSLLQVSPDKLSVLISSMPDLAMRMAKNLADMVRGLNKELLQARESMSLQKLLKQELEVAPRSTLEEILPRIFQEVKQKQHEAMVEVAQTYMRSRVFIEPFMQAVDKTLGMFFNHAIQVRMDNSDDREVLDRICGVDFTGAMSGTFVFMAAAKSLTELGKQIFGDAVSQTMEEDTLLELSRRVIAKVKEDVPGLHLDISLPQPMAGLDSGDDFVGIKLKTDVGFFAWIRLTR